MITVYHSSSSRVALRRSFHRKCKSIRKSPTKFDADSFKFFIPSKWVVNQLSAHLRHLIWILTQMQPKLKGPFWTMVITWLVPSSSISRNLLFILAAGSWMCDVLHARSISRWWHDRKVTLSWYQESWLGVISRTIRYLINYPPDNLNVWRQGEKWLKICKMFVLSNLTKTVAPDRCRKRGL